LLLKLGTVFEAGTRVLSKTLRLLSIMSAGRRASRGALLAELTVDEEAAPSP